MNKLNARFTFITSAILIASLSRLLPHPPNFTAIGAVALFGGAVYANKKLAILLPLLAMLFTDLIIGFHNTMVPVYVCFILTVMIGILINNKVKPATIIISSLSSSILFFVITNYAVWNGSTFYAQTFAGLMLCFESAAAFYTNDIFGSFFLNTLMGDLFFNTLLFGALYLAGIKFPKLADIKK